MTSLESLSVTFFDREEIERREVLVGNLEKDRAVVPRSWNVLLRRRDSVRVALTYHTSFATSPASS